MEIQGAAAWVPALPVAGMAPGDSAGPAPLPGAAPGAAESSAARAAGGSAEAANGAAPAREPAAARPADAAAMYTVPDLPPAQRQALAAAAVAEPARADALGARDPAALWQGLAQGMAAGAGADAVAPGSVLTPVLVTHLFAPQVTGTPFQPVPDAPDTRAAQRRERREHGDESPAPDDAAEPVGDEAEGPPPALAQARPDAHAAWLARAGITLPPSLAAELRRRRGVALLGTSATSGAGHGPVDMVWLGFEQGGAPCVRHHRARGALPPADGWQVWRAWRAGAPASGMRLQARAAPGAPPLALRLTPAPLPPPLREPGSGWLDLLEPLRLWRDWGEQWTLLIAACPVPLPAAR